MADKVQVKRLKRSVQEWNVWRREHPEIQPDLRGADLSEAHLKETNLEGAHLEGAHLDGTYLEGAHLEGAYLEGAYLKGTYLNWAHLEKAHLKEAHLNGAYLSRVYLEEANLNGANLNWAHLERAHLNGAHLNWAYLNGARLNGAHLERAHLEGAYLEGAHLEGAYLEGAHLERASLINTYLNETNLTGVHFWDTLFARVDLSNAKGLETAIHDGPSFVDITSVTLPHDEHTHKHFLAGIGFTLTQIEYLLSLLTPRLTEYHSLFISYAGPDEAIAQRLHTDLCKNDVPCWFAPHDLQPGNYYRERIDRAIHTQDKLLLLLSEHSVQSGWVRYEVELALARENRECREILFPVCLDEAIFHSTASWAVSLRETRHIGDFTGWRNDTTYGKAFAELLQHLKTSKL